MTPTPKRIADPEQLRAEMLQFYGTEHLYRHLGGGVYTDGVKFFADAAGAYWLLDLVFLDLLPFARQHHHEFAHLSVVVAKNAAALTADDGDGNTFWTRDIVFTDLPEGLWSFYLTDNTLLLPSEY
jgi:hypothetical protein